MSENLRKKGRSYLEDGVKAGGKRVKIAPRPRMQVGNASYAHHSRLANGHLAPKNLGAQEGENTEEQEQKDEK